MKGSPSSSSFLPNTNKFHVLKIFYQYSIYIVNWPCVLWLNPYGSPSSDGLNIDTSTKHIKIKFACFPLHSQKQTVIRLKIDYLDSSEISAPCPFFWLTFLGVSFQYLMYVYFHSFSWRIQTFALVHIYLEIINERRWHQ